MTYIFLIKQGNTKRRAWLLELINDKITRG